MIVYITHDHTHLRRFDRVMLLTTERRIIEIAPEDAAEILATQTPSRRAD